MAVVSLGAVVVPLNTMLTPREIAFILKDSRVKHIITDKKLDLAGQYQDGQLPPEQLLTSRINQEVNRATYPAAPEIPVRETAPCVILYTSGTTGRPGRPCCPTATWVSDARSFSSHRPAPMILSACRRCFTASLDLPRATALQRCFPDHPRILPTQEVIATIKEKGVMRAKGVPAMYGFYVNGHPLIWPVRLFASAVLPCSWDTLKLKTGKRVIEGCLSEASLPFASIPCTPQNQAQWAWLSRTWK